MTEESAKFMRKGTENPLFSDMDSEVWIGRLKF